MPYDNDWPLILPGEEEALIEWMKRVEAENPGMSSEVPF